MEGDLALKDTNTTSLMFGRVLLSVIVFVGVLPMALTVGFIDGLWNGCVSWWKVMKQVWGVGKNGQKLKVEVVYPG